MKFSTIPLWTKDRPTAAVDCTHTMALPMPGTPNDNGGAAQLTLCPRSMTLEEVVEYWWRIREWKITVNILSSPGGPHDLYPRRLMDDERELIGTEQAPASGINAYDFIWHDRIAFNLDENGDWIPGGVRYINAFVGLCPPTGWNAVVTDADYGVGSAGNPDFTVLHPYGLPPSDDHPSVRLIYPTLFVAIYGYWEQGTELPISASTLPFPMPPGSTSEPYAISNQNTAIPLTMESDDINHWGVSSFHLAPHAWWPWANADGSEPTWNSGTGARL